ncbi:HAMP domain-containing sensor histidine kinase [Brevibacillus humidisoli]|uniref:HAMP domain-containing sensor histidine kinase n=1 Tax=Brevibacillus humidisoli TaxID=2895522 RepID=UPI0030B9E65D
MSSVQSIANMMRARNKPALKYVVIIILFVSVLLSLRWLWSEVFYAAEQPRAVQGVLDMRGWHFAEAPPIKLNGEWQFFPSAFISHEETSQETVDNPRYVQVPGDWRSAFPEDSESSFGYGTYRLRILVDDFSLDQPYTFWIQDIQASSNVEVNGERQVAFGPPAERAEEYKPKNVSYTVSHTSDGAKEIELLVRVANFDNPFHGGIIRPIHFGSQAAIDTERWYSIGFQLVTFMVLMLHAFYACILYLFNPRQKAFLVFFLLLLTAAISVVSNNDDILMIWLPINYAWALKISLLSYLWLSFLTLLMARAFSGYASQLKLFRTYTALLALYSLFVLAVSPPLIYYSIEAKVFVVLYLFPLAWFVCLIGKMVIQNDHDVIFLLLAATSVVSGVVCGMCNFYQEVTSVFYPIDVMAAIVGFSAYWFKKYFRNSEENAKLNEQLRQADKLKDQFLANTSHELRTPLHGILNIARNIADKEQHTMDAKSLEDMELLITISRRMSHLLDDLLDILRLKEKRIVLQQEPLALQSVVSGVFSMLKFMADGKPVQLKMEIAESMPPIMADEKRLVQILFNLLHNALKYTEEGTVAVSAEARNGHAIIRVSDTGVGIDEETQTRIFMPYEQGANQLSDGRGFGLGLSILQAVGRTPRQRIERWLQSRARLRIQLFASVGRNARVAINSGRLRSSH